MVLKQKIAIDFELTEIQAEIVVAALKGYDTTQTAEAIFRSESTVKNTLTVIMRKLGVPDKVNLVIKLMKAGYVATDEDTVDGLVKQKDMVSNGILPVGFR